MTIEKRALLLFSGGVDSTYQLYLNIQGKKKTDLLYVDGNQGKRKMFAEEVARTKILRLLDSEYNASSLWCSVSTQSNVNFSESPSVGFAQAPAWFIAALEAANPERHSEVQICYIAGDQITGYLDRLIYAWDNLWGIFKQGEKVPLTFPLRLKMKTQIYREIPEDLYHLSWVCELPEYVGDDPHSEGIKYQPCGTCLACTTRELERRRLKVYGNRELPKDHWTLASERYHDKNLVRPVEKADA